MSTTSHALTALALTVALGAALAGPSSAAPLPTEPPEIIGAEGDFHFAEAWEAGPTGDGWFSVDSLVASPTGDFFLFSHSEQAGAGRPDVRRLSATGELIGTWSYEEEDETYATMEAVDIDSDGNLRVLIGGSSRQERPDPPTSASIRTYSPEGTVLSTVPVLEQHVEPGSPRYGQRYRDAGLTVIDDIAYVATVYYTPETDSEADTVVTGFDSDGAVVSTMTVPGMLMRASYDNLVRTTDGRLVMLLSESESGPASVVVASTDGTILDTWTTPAPERASSFRRIALGPDDEVLLNDRLHDLHVLTLDGTPLQTVHLDAQRSPLNSTDQAIGADGRLYVAASSRGANELLVYERLVSTVVSPNTWTATQCVAFSEQIVATGTPEPSFFEVVDGNLPDGLALDATTGAVTGTPTAAGSHAVTVAAHNGVTDEGTQTFALTVQPGVFASTATPVVTGRPVVGSTLTTTVDAWEPVAELAFQWMRDGQPIAGAVTADYTLTGDDAGTSVSVRATGTSACAGASDVSSAALLVEGAPGSQVTVPIPPETSAPAVDTGTSVSTGTLASTGTTVAWVVAAAVVLALSGTGVLVARGRSRTVAGRR